MSFKIVLAKVKNKDKKGQTGTGCFVSSLLPTLVCCGVGAVKANCMEMLKCWSHACWLGMVCVGSLASSDALWDIGQYAKIAALLLFLWLQHPKMVFLSSYLPDRDFSASPVHLDGAISSYGCNKLYFTPVAYYRPCPWWFCHCYLIFTFLFFHEDPKALRFSYWFQPSRRIQMCRNFNLLKSAKTE